MSFIRNIFGISKRLPSKRPLKVLGIETSCDDTAAAIVTSDRQILAEVVRGQQELHEPKGGIVPMLACESHSRNLPGVVSEALQKAKLTVQDLDAIAVTRGPGLPPCLPVGLNAAKTMAAVCGKPLIGVHHMEAHALTARLTTPNADNAPYPQFPFMTLLISGGHTLLLTANNVGDYSELAGTMDNAVGEAIDKASRSLKLNWIQGRRGGPGAALEKAASEGDPERFISKLPLPLSLSRKKELKFSFAGLKSAMDRLVKDPSIDLSNSKDVNDLAAAFQMICINHLEQKIKLALEQEVVKNKKPLNAFVISGGVASNKLFRSRLETLVNAYGLPLICPPPQLCTDNGVMIAWAGLERLQAGLVDDYTITTIPVWPLESLKQRE
ncbi:O-sialoglyco protein endopeptidase [Rhizopus microsporus ATCC 52813]|uniref:N(6)-L-threonylcarbamoyladenine synthase n=1 Tax=Rhizopus microsporus ATCC 52813 TaxID=1340429 RepID=A0A2G4SQG1_RHIZD|nr:O-sialoglyco protein endopeptidase [Rhizopus microsporus ATCC 52813]PHZ10985.1 O-sialoglyco protein endopeptidase [Rhizopus microsporus ATCC 52813]